MCRVDTCSRGTHDRKSYCPDHITLEPYASRVAMEWERRQAESGRLESKPVSADCHYIEEIIIYLRNHRTATIKKMAREMDIKSALLSKVVRYMKRNKQVRTFYGDRNQVFVELV